MTPSASVLAACANTTVITDSEGRQLTIRHLNALDRLRLFKAAGPELAQNEPWLGMAYVAASVIAINDVPVPPPTNELQIEAMIARLGDAGVTAVVQALQQDPEPSATELAENAGNSVGTPT